jgi:hypothetical protein
MFIMRAHLCALRRPITRLLLALATCLVALPALADTWHSVDTEGSPRIHLYFFWTETCPHCQAARPFVEALPARHPWLELHSHNLNADREAARRYVDMAASLGETARSVPAFLFCGRLEVGFDSAEQSGRALEAALIECHREKSANAAVDRNNLPETRTAPPPSPAMTIPGLGAVDLTQWSLPALTLVIAGLDAFNPCAFFVLLFLLSLLIHAGSRLRMLYIGSVFLVFSGLIYFLFMAAWLNVFRWLGELAIVTTAAGVLALVIALINIKDYFWFKQGISLSIPDAAKPGLFQRMRALLRADSLPALTLGTVTLAIAANSYELLCTAGFPMVYTRLLTLADLTPWQHYGWLAIYNLIYVTPLFVITLVFTFTLGSRKLSESEGRVLKLLSGLMMLGLGTLLVAFPAALNDLRVALGLLIASILIAWLIHRRQRQAAASAAQHKGS